MVSGRSGQEVARVVPRAHRADLARSIELFRAFRKEQSDPDFFYQRLAEDSVRQVSTFAPLAGSVVADVGGGPGYFCDAFARLGATYIPVDADAGEMRLHGRTPAPRTVLADGCALPFATGSVDVAYSSNVAEHVRQPWQLGNELVRVVRPGGFVFYSYTLWFGPWGGHETAPWHYLGGVYAARRYQRRTGQPPKNVYGESLFRTTAKQGLRWARSRSDVEVVSAFPRYLPQWSWPVAMLPGLREIAVWNLMLVLRKHAL